MIGKVEITTAPPGTYCLNGWGPADVCAGQVPGCNYTGGHFCDLKAGHKGLCKCVCGSRTRNKPPDERSTAE